MHNIKYLLWVCAILSCTSAFANNNWWTLYDYSQVSAQVMSYEQDEPILRGRAVSLDTGDLDISAFYDTGSMNLRYITLGSIIFKGTPWDGAHEGHSKIGGELFLKNDTSLAWARKNSWKDPRGNDYSPLPRNYIYFKGSFRHNEKVVFHYTVSKELVEIHEMPQAVFKNEKLAFVRYFNVAPHKKTLKLKILEDSAGDFEKALTVRSSKYKIRKNKSGLNYLKIPPSKVAQSFYISYSRTDRDFGLSELDLSSYTRGGSRRWPETVTLSGKLKTDENESFVVDQIPLPFDNPYHSKIRFGGFDFFEDGKSAAFCSWNGDVWIASGLDDSLKNVTWRRFAAGMNETLGLKIVDGLIYVTGKDQITRLHDLNNDGEADYYENFNNDIKITKNFHEFTFGLQVDKQGNFYISKSAPVKKGGRGFDETHDNHGVVFKISPDGRESEVFVSGLRSTGGLAVNPEGTIVTTGENEGTYVQACKINYARKGDFLGVIHPGNGRKEKQGYTKPLCYLPMELDNSGGGQVWVPKGVWGDMEESLVHLSYGKSSAFVVFKEENQKTVQGGVIELPFKLMSSAMRARFNPGRKQEMYIIGFKGWSTNASKSSAVNRITYKDQQFPRVKILKSTTQGIYLTFNTELDKNSAVDLSNYNLERWNYYYSKQYGSAHFATSIPPSTLKQYSEKDSKSIGRVGIPSNRSGEMVYVTAAQLLDDKKTVFLKIVDMKPVDQMKIDYSVASVDGKEINQTIYNTIYTLKKDNRKLSDSVSIEKLKELEKLNTYELGAKVLIVDEKGNKDSFKSRTLSLQVKEGDVISPFLEVGGFTAHYTGYIQVLKKENIYFQAQGSGQFKFVLNDKLALSFAGENALTQSDLFELKAGFHRYTITYKYSADLKSQPLFKVKWNGDRFPLEPVNPFFLRFLSDGAIKKAEGFREKRNFVAGKRCFSCHVSDIDLKMPELFADSPSLKNIGSRLNESWITAWIADPKKLNAYTHMPKLVNAQEAKHIGAYLTNKSENGSSKPVAGKVKQGASLFYDLGCISCHMRPGEEKATFERRSLNHISEKFKPGALKTFLQQPEKYFRWTKMPNFRLSESEAGDLASYLLAASKNYTLPDLKLAEVKGDVSIGENLYQKNYCGNCHNGAPTQKLPIVDLNLGCLERESTRLYMKNFEKWRLTDFLKKNMPSFGKRSTREFSERQIKQLNCIACHHRDDKRSLWESYSAEISDLKIVHSDKGLLDQGRPQITYAGEKLTLDTLENYFLGSLRYETRDWLLARMPGFPARAKLLAEGITLQHANYLEENRKEIDSNLSKYGEKLVGQGEGFACTTCHDVGDQQSVAAFEVKGINLKVSATRLRDDYFLRWMLNPIHIEPTTTMPKYFDDENKSPIPGFDQNAVQQIRAMHDYLKSLPH